MANMHFDASKKDALVNHFSEILRQKEEQLTDQDAAFDRLLQLWQMRVGFIEKLIVLDTGTFALTLSLLSSLGSHGASKQLPATFLPVLYCSWLCLLGSILTGGFHNRRIVLAIEHLFVLNTSTKQEQRLDAGARRFGRTSELLKGIVITP